MEITVHENFWDELILSQFQSKIDSFWKNELKVGLQYNWWPDEVVLDSGPVLTHSWTEDDKSPSIEDIKNRIGKVCDVSKSDSLYCHLHFWLRGSYIPWHKDKDRNGHSGIATTTFLDERIIDGWNWNWGGSHLYMDKDSTVHGPHKRSEIRVEYPEYNKMIMHEGIYHATTILSPSALMRITLQTFKVCCPY